MSDGHSIGYSDSRHEHSAASGTDRSTDRATLVVGLVQVGGVVFTGLLALVLADTARARLAWLVVAIATVLVVGAIHQLVIRRPGKRPLVVGWGQAGGAVLLIAAAVTVLPAWPGSAAAEVVVRQQGYELRPSSSPATNDQDKIDLDTGCPGWGDIRPSLGPPRCGQQADLVVEENELRTTGLLGLVRLPAADPATYAGCVAALHELPYRGVASIRPDEFVPGDRVCLETDRGQLALVEIEHVTVDESGSLASLTIGFTVWRTRG